MVVRNRVTLHKKGGVNASIVEYLSKPECFTKWQIKGKVIAVTVESITQIR